MRNSSDKPLVTVIGAGISGLIAATRLEQLGYYPLVIEADHQPGGRVQTDIVDGYQLDRGFQVLLEAYPKAKEYLDYDKLELQPLDDGSELFEDGLGGQFGDPRRDTRFLLPTLFSSHATLTDKWKIFTLNSDLRKKELHEIFTGPDQTTYEYLVNRGFSPKVINSFFKPFFSGIFLENGLNTSSRMFEFVFKMFGEGSAVIPKGGMGEIAKQLEGKLRNTTFRYDTSVAQVVGTDIFLENGEKLTSDFTIIATNPEKIISNYASSLNWKACDNLYFTVKDRTIKAPIIGLNTNEDALINNIFYPTSLSCKSRGDDELLSITIVKDHDLNEESLIDQIIHELKWDFGIKEVKFLKRYSISQALPNLDDLQLSRDASEQRLTERIALAGDYLLNASLNAAMESGEKAAELAHSTLKNQLIPTG